MKMKGVYEANPALGDPMTIEGKQIFPVALQLVVLKAIEKKRRYSVENLIFVLYFF